MPSNLAAKQLSRIDAPTFVRTVSKSRDSGTEISSLFSYKDPLVKELIWQIKFRNNKKLAFMAAELLYDALVGFMEDSGHFSGFEKPVLVPVPLSKRRLRERGYNQSLLIAREIVNIDKGNNFELAEGAVEKIKDTPAQTSLKRAEREKNIIGCFAVILPKTVRGRNIIILDDVYTTGSTIGELRKVLIEAGAKKVIGFTLTH